LMLLNSCLQWGPLVELLLSRNHLNLQVHWPLVMNMLFLLNFFPTMINLPGFQPMFMDPACLKGSLIFLTGWNIFKWHKRLIGIVGDFNLIRGPHNRNKPGGNVEEMLLFNEVISA
jgi:hypothetical protein